MGPFLKVRKSERDVRSELTEQAQGELVTPGDRVGAAVGAVVAAGAIAALFVGEVRRTDAHHLEAARPVADAESAVCGDQPGRADFVAEAGADADGEARLTGLGDRLVVPAYRDRAVEEGAAGLDVADRGVGFQADDQIVSEGEVVAGGHVQDDAVELEVLRIIDRITAVLARFGAETDRRVDAREVVSLNAGGGADEGDGRHDGASNALQHGHVFSLFSLNGGTKAYLPVLSIYLHIYDYLSNM
jgi:hypothetical protein